jgi:hypothetical protein
MQQKLRALSVVVPVLGLVLLMPSTRAAAQPDGFPWGAQIRPSQCDASGAPVISVVNKVENSVDSGEGGNNWAFDDYTRQIQVWPQGPGTFCVLVSFEGSFDAVAGQQSPGNSGPLDGDEDGRFHGGYWATVSGTLLDDSSWPTRGFAGTHDFGCGIDGSCSGYVSWLDQYFAAGYGFTYEWWGWIYRAGKHGVWINSSDGNSGDIG